MSEAKAIYVDETAVAAVLLPDGKWYRVHDDSFHIRPLQHLEDMGDVTAEFIGFEFTWEIPNSGIKKLLTGPISSLVAVEHKNK